MKSHRGSSMARVASVAMALFAAANIANAQTPEAKSKPNVQLPEQVIQTGDEDAAAASAAPAARSAGMERAATHNVEQDKQRLVDDLIEMTSESSDGLAPSLRADGGSSVDLEGRFMSVAIAAPSEEGGYVVSCSTGEGAAAHAAHAHDVVSRQATEAAAKRAATQPTVSSPLEEK